MYLLNVSLSFCAMPCLGLCIAAPLGAVGVGSGLGIGCSLGHVVRDAKNRQRGDKVCMTGEGRTGGGDCRASEKVGKGGIYKR
jgi:hypothetical protein